MLGSVWDVGCVWGSIRSMYNIKGMQQDKATHVHHDLPAPVVVHNFELPNVPCGFMDNAWTGVGM